VKWQDYANANQGWVEESRGIILGGEQTELQASDYMDGPINPIIWQRDPDHIPIPALGPPYAPIWQESPPPFSANFVNYNTFAEFALNRTFYVIRSVQESIFSEVRPLGGLSGTAVSPQMHDSFHNNFVDSYDPTVPTYDHPHSFLVQPVFRQLGDVHDSSDIVGAINAVVPWDRYLANLLPDGVNGITCVLRNTCEQVYSYELNGNRVSITRPDLHFVFIGTIYNSRSLSQPFL
jgi:hypothetical protein